MGYHTSFEGTLSFDKPISDDLKTYINNFRRTRHCKRNTDVLMKMAKEHNIPLTKFLPPFMSHKTDLTGVEKFFANPYNLCLNDIMLLSSSTAIDMLSNKAIEDMNEPPEDCPSLWCDMFINDKNELEFNDGKFHEYIEWLKWVINNIIAPSGYKLNGYINWRGEDDDDRGCITVNDNEITVDYE
jgi:hypothetical protein